MVNQNLWNAIGAGLALLLVVVAALLLWDTWAVDEEGLVKQAAALIGSSDAELENLLAPALAAPESAFTEKEADRYFADLAIRHQGLKVEKVERLTNGEWKLQTTGRFRLGPIPVLGTKGEVGSQYLTLINPDLIVKVQERKIVPLRTD